jgi:hypothetical protein
LSLKPRIYIVERIRISYFLALSHVARFYATTEQKLIHSFWNALRIRRKINQLHQSSCYTSSIYYTTQNNPWICQYMFNGKVFFDFFCITPHTCKILKKYSRSKNILKMIKQRNQSRQVLFYISNLYTLVCRFHVNKEVYWFLNRPPPFPPRMPPFWQW